MDRQSILGFILIFVLLMVWMQLNAPDPKKIQEEKNKQTTVKDSVNVKVANTDKIKTSFATEIKDTQATDIYGKFFSERKYGKEKIITIETDLYIAEISSKGGVLKTWTLKNYKTWDGIPVQLIDYNNNGDLTILITTTDGKIINTKDLFYDIKSTYKKILLSGTDEYQLICELPSSNGGKIVKKLKFKNGEYGFVKEIEFNNLSNVIANYQYEIAWEHGIRYAEHNSVGESSFAAAYAYAANEITEINATSFDKKEQKEFSGKIDWVATRNKYFTVAIMPADTASEGAFIEGIAKPMPDHGNVETYCISMKMPYMGNMVEKYSYKIYLGPIKHDELVAYGKNLEKIMSLGWAWIIRPISEYIFLPLFNAIHSVIPNWGLVLIIFSIIIKVAMHPLSKSQMKSMKKMQKLQPLMNEVREKYKDDPQKMNQAVMALYKDYGVNPAGGCLPLLLQMPIMIALFSLLSGAIELRQAPFVGWITDLSIPDVIYSLPFNIPLLGIKDISGIALLMGVTMFFQTKMTTTDPRQKSMVWMMPIMMTILFMTFPSGLNLYYTVFNVLSIGQQMIINKKSEDDDEPLRKVDHKKKSHGGIFKLAKDLPRLKK